MGPQLLDQIIAFVQDPDAPSWKGYFYPVSLSVVAFVTSVCDSNYWGSLSLVGLRIRTAVSMAVYKKTMTLSSAAKQEQVLL